MSAAVRMVLGLRALRAESRPLARVGATDLLPGLDTIVLGLTIGAIAGGVGGYYVARKSPAWIVPAVIGGAYVGGTAVGLLVNAMIPPPPPKPQALPSFEGP